jgi:hypothetical protein
LLVILFHREYYKLYGTLTLCFKKELNVSQSVSHSLTYYERICITSFFLRHSGGLLFPWHIGALAGLTYHNVLDDSNPLAGSSAGAIAVASHGAGVRPEGE